jgi:hypothetical protein
MNTEAKADSNVAKALDEIIEFDFSFSPSVLYLIIN